MQKARSFKDLEVWKKAHELALVSYKITHKFPKEEVFGLTNQIRRAAVSVASNIAEGFCRKTTKDKLQFYSIAQGSLSELESQFLIAKDVGYLTSEDFYLAENIIISTGNLLGGLRRSLTSP
jgi:four helix bundle protein